MSWVKLDDQFTDHPKVVQAGPLAAWLYVCGLAYCARQLTDGFVPTGQLRRLLPTSSVSKLAQRLVDVRLWEPAPGGFRVHDYLQYNPTRQQTMALREQKASAGRRGGQQKASTVLAEASTVLADRQPSASAPVPVPQPVPHEAASPSQHLPEETDTEAIQRVATAAPPRPPVRPVPKPSESPEARSEHRLTVEALVTEFHPSEPPNAAEIGRIVKASKLLRQSHVQPPEVHVLAERARERWGDEAEVTPLGIANNVTALRTERPATKPQNGRRVIDDPMEQSRRVAMALQARSDAEQIQRRALA